MPNERQLDALARQDAEHLRLGQAAGDVVGAAEVVLADADLHAGVWVRNPFLAARQNREGCFMGPDPRFLLVRRVPQVACRTHPVSIQSRVAAESLERPLAVDLTLRIPVNVEHVDELLA